MLLRISAAGLRKVLVSGSGRRQIDLTYLSLILERTASKFHNGGCATSSMVMVMPFIVWQHKMRVYRSYASKGRLMDPSEVKTADAVDRFLRKRIPQMERVLAGQGLSALRGKREGAVKFWYGVGVELRKLWAEVQEKFEVPDAELDLFLWAVNDHAKLFKVTTPPEPKRSLLYRAYFTAQFPEETVKRVGTWTEWIRLLDSKRAKADKRIVEWFADRAITSQPPNGCTRKKWFGTLMKAITARFERIDTTVLTKGELYQRLDDLVAGLRETKR